MRSLIKNNKFIYKNYIFLIFVLSSLILAVVQIAALKTSIGILGILAVNALLLSVLFYFVFIKDFSTYLLFLTILPLALIEHQFSRNFKYILLQNIPLYIFFFLALAKYFKDEKFSEIKLTPINKSIWLYTIVVIILTVRGFLEGGSAEIINEEFYQSFYFFLAIPIGFLLNKREQYRYLFNVIVVVFSVIAVEYIIINFMVPGRFTTYHNHYFPFVAAILAAVFLYGKRGIYKFYTIIGTIIIWWGSYATGTRTLLVANFIATIIVLLFYFKNKKSRYLILKISVFIILFLLPLMLPGDKKAVRNSNDPSQRIQGLSDPLGEATLLMRFEAVYLGMKEIVKDPFWGKGFGYQLQMKYLLQTRYTFPDNNYIYYLLKGGIVFFIIALIMFLTFIRYSYKLFVSTNVNYVKIIMLANIGGMIALMFFGLLNANLVKLKLNILYALSFAYINYELRKSNETLDKTLDKTNPV